MTKKGLLLLIFSIVILILSLIYSSSLSKNSDTLTNIDQFNSRKVELMARQGQIDDMIDDINRSIQEELSKQSDLSIVLESLQDQRSETNGTLSQGTTTVNAPIQPLPRVTRAS